MSDESSREQLRREYRGTRRAGMPLLLAVLTLATVMAMDSLATPWLVTLWCATWLFVLSPCWRRTWGTAGQRVVIAAGTGWSGLWLGLGLHRDALIGAQRELWFAGWPLTAYIGELHVPGPGEESVLATLHALPFFAGPCLRESAPCVGNLLVFAAAGALLAILLRPDRVLIAVRVLHVAAPATVPIAFLLGFQLLH